jgi:hypothetical protein
VVSASSCITSPGERAASCPCSGDRFPWAVKQAWEGGSW